MTDQIPADDLRRFIARYRAAVNDRGSILLDELESLLPAPPLPTLADMTNDERAACQWMQADVDGFGRLMVIENLRSEQAELIERNGERWVMPIERVTPRPDLPRLEWPGDTPAPTPATLAEGSEWGDIDALSTACRESGRDQITVIDTDGDVSVWNGIAGWWQTGTPSDGYEPYTILHTGKEADQ